MQRDQLQILILVDKKGESKSYRFHRLKRENTHGQIILELVNDQEIHNFRINQVGDGITDLVDVQGETYRVLGLSYHVLTLANTVEFKFHIADSFHQALDINKFISFDATDLL